MRFKIGGSIQDVKPLLLVLRDGVAFEPETYLDLRYTYFDAICIGAGGGRGGGLTVVGLPGDNRCTGGAGGGGGLHRVRGVLAALPSSCDVVVGTGGAVGHEEIFDHTLTTDGEDGGYSSFNSDTCQASGGKGGKRVQDNSGTISTGADGGQGGVGGSVVAGGGAIGGVAGIMSDIFDHPSTWGADGAWDGTVGQGGGGGAGGIGRFGGISMLPATSGGYGSWNDNDQSVTVRGTDPIADVITGAADIVPGGAGGATAYPLTGLETPHGQSFGQMDHPGGDGWVVIYLT